MLRSDRGRNNRPDEFRLVFTGIVVLFVIVLAVVALLAVTARYDVDLQTDIDQIEGNVILLNGRGREIEISEPVTTALIPGDTLIVGEGGSVRAEIVEGSGAYAYLNGAVVWELVTAWRHGTMLEHARLDAQDYRVVMGQTGTGTVVYDFSLADPSLVELDVMLVLPDADYVPASPCFQVTAPGGGLPSTVIDIPCRGEQVITPVLEPTLPQLP